jgi:membrane protease YdiL (CAAX protease family)
MNPGWTVLGLTTVFGFGLVACFLLRRTGDLWMPIGLHIGPGARSTSMASLAAD